MQKIPPNVKKHLDMQMPDNDFIQMDDGSQVSSVLMRPEVHPTTFLKYMNTNFEVFF